MKIKEQSGVSVILIVGVLLILSILGAVIVSVITSESETSLKEVQSTKAYYIAQGGIEYGLYTATRGGGSWGEFTFANRPTGSGNFTLSVYTSIVGSKRQMTLESVGRVPAVNPTAERKLRTIMIRGAGGGATILNEPFPVGSVPVDTLPANGCASNPALSWCYSYTNTGGNSQYDGTQNASGPTGGSLLAKTTGANSARLTGYRQRTLASTIAPNTQITLSLQYRKDRAGGLPPAMTMAVNLVATDGTPYQLWSDTGTSNVSWTPATVNWTVPVAKTIDRIRLSFNLRDKATGAGVLSVWFDDVNLTTPGGAIPISIINWQEVY